MTTNHEVAGVHTAQALPTAGDIRGIIERKIRNRLAEESRHRKAVEAELEQQKKAFDARKLTPQFIDLVMSRIRQAAENGEYNILVGQFPSAWCSDGGRSINVREEGWPETLPSFAREFFEFWKRAEAQGIQALRGDRHLQGRRPARRRRRLSVVEGLRRPTERRAPDRSTRRSLAAA